MVVAVKVQQDILKELAKAVGQELKKPSKKASAHKKRKKQ